MNGGFMSRKFKEGDVVWCTDDMYRITSYHRPCLVKGYDRSGNLLLQAFDQSNLAVHDVRDIYFELVPSYKVLKYGQMIRVKGLDRLVKFKKYKNRGYIEVVDGNRLSEYYVDDIVFREGFYI